MRINIKRIGNWINNNFYVIVMLTYFLAMIYNTQTHFLRFIWLLILSFSFKLFFKKPNPIVQLVLIYVGYNLLSIVAYKYNGLPTSLFFSDIINSILPITFFFIGYDKQVTNNVFYKRTLFAITFMFIVGLYLYLTAPGWYVDWQVNKLSEIYKEVTVKKFLETGRFSSFLTSYFTSNLSIVSIVISLYFIIRKGLNFTYLIVFFISFVSMVLSQQRVAILGGTVVILAFNLYEIFNRKKGFYYIFFIELALVFFSGYILINRFGNMFYLGLERLTLLSGAVSERSDTWINLLAHQTNFVIGHGLGTGGHAAFFYGKMDVVTDGNYFKIFYEMGIIGTLLFLAILISSLFRAIKYFKYLSIETVIIGFFMFSAIGSNVFTMSYIIVIFWYCLGRIWNKEYLKELIKTGTKI